MREIEVRNGRRRFEEIYVPSNEAGNFGLTCRPDGLALAGVPLLRRTSAGLRSRPWAEIRGLLGRAYDMDADVTLVIGGLGIVAHALNTGDMLLAHKTAARLKLAKLDWDGAARLAHAEEAICKYNADQPRDWHGRWGSGTGSPAAGGQAIPASVTPLGK